MFFAARGSAPGPPPERSYHEYRYWQRYQEFFPGGLRVTAGAEPVEEWWDWRGVRVHLDRVPRPDAPGKLIVLHGAAGYGRMLAPYTRLPAASALETLAPDLPGCGLSVPGGSWGYPSWVDCVVDLVRAESARDARPIVLAGASLGGLLAYGVACRVDVSGVVATGLLDPRRRAVRRRLAARPWFGDLARPTLACAPRILDRAGIPVRWIANIATVSNLSRLNALVAADVLAGGARLSPRFLRTFLASRPPLEPEMFTTCPVLLAHPGEDAWSPLALSRPFLDRMRVRTRLAVLRGVGHMPVEETGLGDLDGALRDFFDELGLD